MRALIFASKSRPVDPLKSKELIRAFRLNGLRVESYDPDEKRGSELAETYGLMDYPSLVIVTDEGSVQNSWQGSLPNDGEIAMSAGHL